MSRSFSDLLRATSPGHEAIIEALRKDDEDELKIRDARHAKIFACTSVQEIIESIPSDYRDKCAELLRDGYKQAHLRGSANKVQFTSGYKDSDAAQAAQRDTDDRFHKYQVASLTADIAAKRAEVKFLEEARVIQIATSIATAANAKIEKKKSIAATATVAASDGADVVMTDATLSAALKAEIKRTVMGLMPRDRKGGPAQPSKATKQAREAAAATQAKITPGYESVLPGYIVRPRIRALTTFGYSGRRKKRSRKPKQAKEEYVVMAKAEGSKRKQKKKRGAQQRQQQQQQQKTIRLEAAALKPSSTKGEI
ncbi:hypothetical protein EDB87DRAFT_1696926 [Lactarius vividus]|nr:hypothetical protein EDB87DRAFT_1696926 [Lactarius vividus]